MPASPIRPVPSSTRLEGSGVTATPVTLTPVMFMLPSTGAASANFRMLLLPSETNEPWISV